MHTIDRGKAPFFTRKPFNQTKRKELIMKFTKILACALAAVLCLAALASCSDSSTLKIATNAEFPPFESLENGEYVGFDVDLIRAIAAEKGLEIQFENMEFEGVLAAVTSGSSDIGLSGLTITEARKATVDFTDPYLSVGQVLIVRADDAVFTGTDKATLDEQLKGKTVAACSGYTGQLYIEGTDFPKIEGLTTKIYDNPALAVADLTGGKVDAFILDDAVANALAAENTAIKVINVPLTVEDYAMAVNKGNTELLNTLNEGLATLKATGKLDEMLKTWDLA